MKKIIKLIKILFKPLWIKGLFYNIVATTEHEYIKNYLPKINTLIDIGSNKGQFMIFLKYFYPHIEIYSFEPINEMIKKQKKFFKNKKKIYYFNYALGNKSDIKIFNITRRTDSSSLYKISKNNNSNSDYDIIDKFKVKVNKLDNILTHNIKKPILTKIDVQGYELEVLKGANKILDKIDYLFIEVSKNQIYINQAVYKEILIFLKKKNFIEIKASNWSKIKKTNFYQKDILFKKMS